MVKAELTFMNDTELAGGVGGWGGCRDPVTGLDSMCKKPHLSDLWHTTLEDQRAELSNGAFDLCWCLLTRWWRTEAREAKMKRFEPSWRLAWKRESDSFHFKTVAGTAPPFCHLFATEHIHCFHHYTSDTHHRKTSSLLVYTHPQPLTRKHTHSWLPLHDWKRKWSTTWALEIRPRTVRTFKAKLITCNFDWIFSG